MWETVGNKMNAFIEDYLLEFFVGIPWLENSIRSYRLGEKDIKIMGEKGYRVFDANKGRFVRELLKSISISAE
jgi:hypothetical protein